MKAIVLPSGEQVPALGMGTWMMGEYAARRAEEMDALRCGIDLGMTLIDTAEMFAPYAAAISGLGRVRSPRGGGDAIRRAVIFCAVGTGRGPT